MPTKGSYLQPTDKQKMWGKYEVVLGQKCPILFKKTHGLLSKNKKSFTTGVKRPKTKASNSPISLVQQDKICFRVKCCVQLPEVRTVLGDWVLEICLLFVKKYELDIKVWNTKNQTGWKFICINHAHVTFLPSLIPPQKQVKSIRVWALVLGFSHVHTIAKAMGIVQYKHKTNKGQYRKNTSLSDPHADTVSKYLTPRLFKAQMFALNGISDGRRRCPLPCLRKQIRKQEVKVAWLFLGQ